MAIGKLTRVPCVRCARNIAEFREGYLETKHCLACTDELAKIATESFEAMLTADQLNAFRHYQRAMEARQTVYNLSS